ncbi:MAG: energy-coupling factor ABC transporter permease [Nitrospirae bacterium]|nr:energy-coupling factor ABC transporter permease [Nitrospirota bacterium]MBI5694748.1 energy-coupling factor ABC transporter permease [Nitrospirota bacterium]
MTHLHIPDGLLPVWLWAAGLVLAAAAVTLALFMVRRMDLRRKIPLLGMMSAVMLVCMSIEVAPYHLNLTVLTGIILGPWLSILAALIVNIVLALVGHGGVTVAGLNTLVIAFEGVTGYVLFSAFRKFTKPGVSAAAATFLTLFMSTCIMLIMVFAGNLDLAASSAEEISDVMQSAPADSVRRILDMGGGFNIKFFAAASFGMGILGWSLEAFVTAVAVKFIDRVRPGMVGGRS